MNLSIKLSCLIVTGVLAPSAWTAAEEKPFTFAALGCMPYASMPDAGPSYVRLIREINRHAPAFTVHVGDLLAGGEASNDALYMKRREEFNSFDGPLIYTPGDNEWTDTHAERFGRFDPLERLTRLRQIFFAEERSLGRRTLPLVTQRREPRFAKFVENARWTHGGVVFATVHVVGSRNNHQPNIPGAVEEFRERDGANESWVRAAFRHAREIRAPGLALFFQANPFAVDYNRPGYRDGYERFVKTVEEEARAFARPVLLVHADEHRFRLDFGMRFEAGAEPLPNVTRIETFGAQDFHAVLVTVSPDSRRVFLPGPLMVPGNALPALK